MRRKPRKLPDYFTEEEASNLVAAAPDYKTRMAMKIMVRTGLRVSECVSLSPADLRLKQDPPIISVRPEITGNKAKVGREVPIPAVFEAFVRQYYRKQALTHRVLPGNRPNPSTPEHETYGA